MKDLLDFFLERAYSSYDDLYNIIELEHSKGNDLIKRYRTCGELLDRDYWKVFLSKYPSDNKVLSLGELSNLWNTPVNVIKGYIYLVLKDIVNDVNLLFVKYHYCGVRVRTDEEWELVDVELSQVFKRCE